MIFQSVTASATKNNQIGKNLAKNEEELLVQHFFNITFIFKTRNPGFSGTRSVTIYKYLVEDQFTDLMDLLKIPLEKRNFAELRNQIQNLIVEKDNLSAQMIDTFNVTKK